MNKRDKATIEEWRAKNREACALLQVERDKLQVDNQTVRAELAEAKSCITSLELAALAMVPHTELDAVIESLSLSERRIVELEQTIAAMTAHPDVIAARRRATIEKYESQKLEAERILAEFKENEHGG